MIWIVDIESGFIPSQPYFYGSYILSLKDKTFIPALTLQELRDVAQREFAGEIVADPVFANSFETWVYTSSAPDLAEWLIARLEGKP
jgi:hypothetical protein